MAPRNSNIGKASSQVKADLKEFRSKIAQLKRKNIAYKSKKTTQVKPTRYAKELLRRIETTGFFDNAARVQKVSKIEGNILKERGYVVKGNRVILPASVTRSEKLVKVKGEKHRSLHFIGDGEQGTKDLIPVQSWETYLLYMKDKWKNFEANGHQIAFRFYGHLSRRTFTDIDKALASLSAYSSHGDGIALNQLNPSDMQDVIQHIEIYKTNIETWDKQDHKRREKQEKRKSKPRPYKVRMAKIMQKEGRTVYQAKLTQESKKRAVRRKRIKNGKTK